MQLPTQGERRRPVVKRNGRGPTYWTVCRITACEPAREFGFEVLAGGRVVNTWHYAFRASDHGTDVTESFRLPASPATRVYWALFGRARGRTNRANMRTTLQRIKAVAETG